MITTLIKGARNIAILSAFCLAITFGAISPKIRTATVITTVETVEPRLLGSSTTPVNKPMKKIVAIDESAMFTILLPINTLVKNLSYLLSILLTRFARLLPLCARFFILILLNDVNAVSVDEKNAEKTSKIAITAMKPSSFGPKLAIKSGIILVLLGSASIKKMSFQKYFHLLYHIYTHMSSKFAFFAILFRHFCSLFFTPLSSILTLFVALTLDKY